MSLKKISAKYSSEETASKLFKQVKLVKTLKTVFLDLVLKRRLK